MLIIGERINSSRKSIYNAISSRDAGFIQNEAKMQADAGANYIDVNAGAFIDDEEEHLKWIIDVVQNVCELPFCIDSPDPNVIKSVLPLLDKAPIINSVTLEPSRLENILRLTIDYKAKLVGLCQAESLTAETTEGKLEIAGRLIEEVTKIGLALDDFYIDPLIYPLSTNDSAGLHALHVIEKITQQYQGVHTTCGLTNISYGLPGRSIINRTFLIAAIMYGLESVIMDPTDKLLYSSLKAAILINGRDEFCMEYITAYRDGRL